MGVLNRSVELMAAAGAAGVRIPVRTRQPAAQRVVVEPESLLSSPEQKNLEVRKFAVGAVRSVGGAQHRKQIGQISHHALNGAGVVVGDWGAVANQPPSGAVAPAYH